jgi:DNA replication and repair protein RecF
LRVAHLSLTNFRNYNTAEVPFEAGPNLFVGRNGQGKTNLIESLGYLSTLGSHRVSTDQALIQQGFDAAVIRARVQNDAREALVEVQLNRTGANRAQVNRSAIRPRELPRYFSSVLFAPEDLALVRGEPGVRRRFIDQLLVQRNPRMAGVLSDYERVLKQRNTLLKSVRAAGLKGAQLSTLDIWDERLVSLGAEIIDARASLIERLRGPLSAAYRSVVGDDHSPKLREQLSILGSDPDEIENAAFNAPAYREAEHNDAARDSPSRFRESLARLRPKELERGLTLVGPHRDDVIFELNDLPAKGYASHGESWSFALSLKLSAAELLRRESATGDPVLILDDVFAELDQGRRKKLASAIGDYEQVLITAAVLDDVPTELTSNSVRIDSGAVVHD